MIALKLWGDKIEYNNPNPCLCIVMCESQNKQLNIFYTFF